MYNMVSDICRRFYGGMGERVTASWFLYELMNKVSVAWGRLIEGLAGAQSAEVGVYGLWVLELTWSQTSFLS